MRWEKKSSPLTGIRVKSVMEKGRKKGQKKDRRGWQEDQNDDKSDDGEDRHLSRTAEDLVQ